MYQEVVDLIRTASIQVNPTGTFIHGRRADGSIEYDKPMPQIHLYPFVSSPQDGNRAFVNNDIVMGFWKQDAPDTSNEEREEIISAMDTLSKEFLEALDEGVLEISNIRKEPQYRTLSATLSGYAITFRLKTHTSPC